MLTSYSRCVDGLGGVGHVNVMFMVRGNFEKEHVAACCSRVLTLKQQRAKKGDYQHVPFHANIKNIANTNKKTALHITPQTAVKTVLFRFKKTTAFMKCAISCGKTRKSETLKKNMLQQADEVEATTSKKRLTINMCRFMLTLKFTANTNKKKTPLHITPRAAVKNDNSGFKKKS